jgi:hypothetical protein
MVEILFLMLPFHILTNSSNSHSLNQEGLYSHHSSGISLIKKSKLNRKILHIFRSSATKMYNSDKPNWIYVSHVRLILFIFPHIFSAPPFSFCSSCHILDCSDANVFCMLSIYRSFCSAFNLLCKVLSKEFNLFASGLIFQLFFVHFLSVKTLLLVVNQYFSVLKIYFIYVFVYM